MTLKEDNSNYSVQEESPPLNAGSPKDVSSFLAKLKKTYGDNIQFAGVKRSVETVSTGSLILDLATGIGGYPRGRITILAGWESAGKTTHALRSAAILQQKGGVIGYIDTEFALDLDWAEKLGVNTDESVFTVIQPEDLETAGEAAVEMATSGVFDMIIFDSVAGAPIKAVVDGDLGDSNMGRRAKLMSDFMPKLNGPVSRNHVWMIFTNQLRDSLNMYKPKPVRPGGHALNFHASMIIDFSAKRTPSGGSEVKARVEKNKLSTPGKDALYTVNSDGSIDLVDELAEIITTPEYSEILGVTRSGSWYNVPKEWSPDVEEPKYQGKPALTTFLAEVEAFERVASYVKDKMLR